MEFTLPQLLVPAIVALSGVITVLWKQTTDRQTKTEEKLVQCEEQHVQHNTRMIHLSEKIGKLEGRQAGIEELSQAVLKEVRNAVSENTRTDEGN